MKRYLALILSCVMLLCTCTTLIWEKQYDLSIRCLSEGNYEEAITTFTATIKIDPRRAPAYVGQGDAYLASGETEENLMAAQTDYETAVALDETNINVYLKLADLQIQQGDTDWVVEILQRGLEKLVIRVFRSCWTG